MTDRYEKIRQALAMGPTPGPWYWIGDSLTHRQFNIYAINGTDKHIATVNDLPVEKLWALDQVESEATAKLIAACDPDTIRALLDERDALRKALARLITWTPSADTYRRLGFDPDAPMRVVEEARAALAQEGGQ
jgi:hypothetical protein